MKRKDIHDRLMDVTWLVTTACCTALHDIGFDAEEIAEVMPEAMKALADAIIEQRYGGSGLPWPYTRPSLLPGDAIKAGQDYAERLAASRAAVQS
jgi:hypothetical protein